MKVLNKKKIEENTVGITAELINRIIFEIEKDNVQAINLIISKMHPADTADILETLSEDNRIKVIKALGRNFPAETLPSMNVPILISIIDLFDHSHLVSLLSRLDTDDITYVLIEFCIN